MSFNNTQIDTATLPSITEIDYLRVHKNSLTISLIGAVIWWSFVLITASVFIYFNNFDYPSFINYIVLGVLISLAILSIVLNVFGFRRKGYALRERDISYREGVIWKSHTVIPFNRIQHSEVTQGPVQSMFELASISIYTAGGSASDLTITGLQQDEAHQIKDFLLHKITRHEEE